MVRKLAQMPQKIWMTLCKWLLKKRKRQQREDNRTKKPGDLNSKDTVKVPDKDCNNSNMPNQHARDQNVLKGKEVVSLVRHKALLMNFLKKLVSVRIYKNLDTRQNMIFGLQITMYMQVSV